MCACVRACVGCYVKKEKRPRNKFGGTMFAAVWSHAYEASIYGASVGARIMGFQYVSSSPYRNLRVDRW